MARETLPFTVSITYTDREETPPKKKGGDPDWKFVEVTQWLKADGKLTDQEEEAVQFEIYKSPTPTERGHIERGMHDVAGSLKDYLDLEGGIRHTRDQLMAKLEGQLWPDGRPDVTGPAQLAQQTAIEKAWLAEDSTLKAAWQTMTQMEDRLRFIAMWKVLIIDAPDGWADIADREMEEPVFLGIWSAWVAARMSVVSEPSRSSEP